MSHQKEIRGKQSRLLGVVVLVGRPRELAVSIDHPVCDDEGRAAVREDGVHAPSRARVCVKVEQLRAAKGQRQLVGHQPVVVARGRDAAAEERV
eukprot:850164-Pleurochrysis_carterae.AAC.2